MPDPPPIGSLWEHKDGERRYVEAVLFGVMDTLVGFRRTSGPDSTTLRDWHAWERDATRIDKEQS